MDCRFVSRCLLPLLFSVAPLAPTRDGDDALAAMTARSAKLERVRVLVRNETRLRDGAPTVRYFESFIDVRGGRVRTQVRDFGRATPHLVSVYADGLLRVRQLECGETAEQSRPFALGEALSATAAGELAAAAFLGRPPSFAAAPGKATLADGGEAIGGVGCTRVTLPGAQPVDLWIGDGDGFPRRVRGKSGPLELEETVVELDLAPDFRAVEFALPLPEGAPRLDMAAARRAWAKLGPEEARWPQPGDDSPDFAGVDLEGKVRLLSETAEQEVVLAFWNHELPASVDGAAAFEAAWRERGAKPLLFWHVAAGRDRAAVLSAVGRASLREMVVVAGEHAKNAFAQFSIWRCPVYVRLSDLQVVEVTADLAQAKRWLR
ncbi:MAG: hypothetical protein JNL90_05080 [Planctomycetes bacterium]|nr:hypothetical protein [Planctomycetota bacterium]